MFKVLDPRTGAVRDVGPIALLDLADIEVVRSESLIFSDGSLGCPQPDVVYTQAPVPGYRIVLDADGQPLDYRVTERGYMMLCEQAVLHVSPSGGGADR